MKATSHNRTKGLIIAGLILATTIAPLVRAPLAAADAVTAGSATVDQQVQAYLYAGSIANCFQFGKVPTSISVSDVQSGNIFATNNPKKKPVVDTVGEGWSDCGGSDHSWVVNAANFFGYGSVEKMMVAFGWRYVQKDSQGESVYSPPANFDPNNKDALSGPAYDALKKAWGGPFTWGHPQNYWAAQGAFQSACRPQEDTKNSPSSLTATLLDPNDAGKTVQKKYTVSDPNGTTYLRTDYGGPAGGDGSGRVPETCSQLADILNKQAKDYETYIRANPSKKPSPDAVQRTSKSSDASAANGGKNTCNPDIGGVGWIVCPVMTFMANMFDSAFGFLADSFLSFDSTLVDPATARGPMTYQVWGNFRNIANVIFVIAIMAVVLSQVTSIGISNYGIKKLLPRIIITAILVNVSYYLCSLAIDVSNLLGYGISGLFNNMAPVVEVSKDGSVGHVIGRISAYAIMGSILVPGIAGIALALSGSVILAGLLALGIMVLILMLRKALIILLVIVAPLAFAAYLLPNTEQWFKRWWKLFYTLLLLFPIVGIVFAAAKLASTVIYESNPKDVPTQLTALGVMSLPFFAVPSLLKGALSGTGALGQKISGFSTKATERVGAKIKTDTSLGAFNEARKRQSLIKRQQILGGTYKGGRLHVMGNLSSRMHNSLNQSRITGKLGDRVASTAAQTADKIEIENVEAKAALMRQANLPINAIEALARGENAGGMRGGDAETMAAAAQHLLKTGRIGAVADAWDHMRDTGSKDDRRIFAGAMSRSKGRPAYIGAGTIAGMSTTDNEQRSQILTFDEAAVKGTNEGALSPEGMANAPKEHLDYLHSLEEKGATQRNGAPLDTDRLKDTAFMALNNENINKSIGKNRDEINAFHTGTTIPTSSGPDGNETTRRRRYTPTTP